MISISLAPRSPARGPLFAAVALFSAVLLGAAACGIRPASLGDPSPGPVTEPGARPGAGESHRITYWVRCDSCTVSYSRSSDHRVETVEGGWQRTAVVRAGSRGAVTLVVTPVDGSWIRDAHIEREGRRVARMDRDQGMVRHTVTLTAALPPA